MSSVHVPLDKDQLWAILVETARALPMYKGHKRYVQDVMLKERPGLSAKELSVQLNIPLGEAIVLLDEIRGPQLKEAAPDNLAGRPKPADRSLLDFGT